MKLVSSSVPKIGERCERDSRPLHNGALLYCKQRLLLANIHIPIDRRHGWLNIRKRDVCGMKKLVEVMFEVTALILVCIPAELN